LVNDLWTFSIQKVSPIFYVDQKLLNYMISQHIHTRGYIQYTVIIFHNRPDISNISFNQHRSDLRGFSKFIATLYCDAHLKSKITRDTQ